MRRLAAVVALLLAGSLLAVAPASAAVACPEPYAEPQIPFVVSRSVTRPGESFVVQGTLQRNGCGLANQRVGLFVRDRMGPFSYHSQRVTDANGYFRFVYATWRSVDLVVVFSGAGEQPRAVSRTWHQVVTHRPDQVFRPNCDPPLSAPPPGQVARGFTVESERFADVAAVGHPVWQEYAVRNTTDSPKNIVLHGRGVTVLRNPRSGELMSSWCRWSGQQSVSTFTLGPGEAIALTDGAQTTSDIYASTGIPVGTYEVIDARRIETADQGPAWWYGPIRTVRVVERLSRR